MSQASDDLGQVIGYVLKHTQATLRARMDEVLRPLGLTAPQYACLELLSRTSGISNSDLARGAFVTRQTMNTLLRGLQDRGLVERADQAPSGRARPATLSAEGARLLADASQQVNAIDAQMVAGLTAHQRSDLRRYLAACIAALEGGPGGGATVS
ncbi:MAG TPA: MarR family transcriptional regulator [Cellulomonadaceae bacterium]|nr:MarR family transcriptional regulator [Cellulomonadaceae bacterium]